MMCCRAGLGLVALAVAAFAGAARGAPEDPRDLLVIMPALNDTLENERSGKDTTWTNVATRRSGTIRIERTFYRGLQPCREYTRTTAGNGPGYEVRGTGCRIGKLNWSVEEALTENPSPATAAAPAAAAPSAPASEPPAATAPSGDPSARAPRKAAPPPPPQLRYGLPTRSEL
jgi:surface antigen